MNNMMIFAQGRRDRPARQPAGPGADNGRKGEDGVFAAMGVWPGAANGARSAPRRPAIRRCRGVTRVHFWPSHPNCR